MKEQFVTYEIALALKELGFDEECFGYYSEQHDKTKILYLYQEEDYFDEIRLEAPLWQQIIDWLRETYKINILIVPIYSSENLKGYVFNFGLITMDNLSEVFKNGKFETFYKAREQAILKAVELCQKK